MIDPASFLILLVVTVGLSQVVWPRHRAARLFWLTAPGALLMFVVSERALLLAVASLAVSVTVYLVGRHTGSDRLRARLPYAILLLLLVPDVLQIARDVPVLFLGSAFFVVRQMMTVAQALKAEVGLATFAPALVLATFFVAAVPSGPVFNGLTTWDALGEGRPADNAGGLPRLFEGFVFLFAIAGFAGWAVGVGEVVRAQDVGVVGHGIVTILLLPVAAFAVLFATFYGYSRMAEGTALLFGFTVPQNFDRPHLATDLGDYWKRWHRSMAEFVMQYLYLPLLVTTRRTKVALVTAFVFMGLWHDLSPQFLVWGVGHGLGLGVVLPWARRRGVSPTTIRTGSLLWVLTLSSVAHGVWR